MSHEKILSDTTSAAGTRWLGFHAWEVRDSRVTGRSHARQVTRPRRGAPVEQLAVVIADVDAILTEYLSGYLERRGHRTLIAVPVYAAVREAVRSFNADLCLLDPALRDSSDMAEVEQLTASAPRTGVVIRTADPSSQRMHLALAAGVVGYLHKTHGVQMLYESLTRITHGEVVVEGSFTRAPRSTNSAEAAILARQIASLTVRERECLSMIGSGTSTEAMAAALGVSTRTVRSHVQSLLGKLGVHSRLAAAALTTRLPSSSG